MSRLERGKRYTNPEDFFSLDGSAAMRLTPDAAQGVCFLAGSRGGVVLRVEGGFWKDPDFEARGDCIWDGVDPPVSADEAIINNEAAARFIESKSKVHDVFIVTVSLRSAIEVAVRTTESSDR